MDSNSSFPSSSSSAPLPLLLIFLRWNICIVRGQGVCVLLLLLLLFLLLLLPRTHTVLSISFSLPSNLLPPSLPPSLSLHFIHPSSSPFLLEFPSFIRPSLLFLKYVFFLSLTTKYIGKQHTL